MKSKLEKIMKKMDILMEDIINKRRSCNGLVRKSGEGNIEVEDLLDVFLRLQQELPITDNNIKAVIIELFMGGTETSASVIEWAMSEMIKNPKVMEKAQSELRLALNKVKNIEESAKDGLQYLRLIIKETLRLHPPAPLLVPRECTEACEIGGYNIAAKSKVIVNAWAIGRDPDVWEDEEKFIPERFEKNMLEFYGNNFEYIPFGAGRRVCPGISFGLATVELVLSQLLYHFNWKLPNGIKPEELDMRETPGITAKKRQPLLVIADFNVES